MQATRVKEIMIAVLGLGLLWAAPSSADQLHTATRENIRGHWTYLDMAGVNGDPNRLLLVTQIWNPAGGSGVYNDHSIGVWYDASYAGGRWAIFNQDFAPMPEGASFYVYSHAPSDNFRAHRCAAADIRGNYCYIDSPFANGHPEALLFVTANWNPGNAGGTYNNHHIGVWYDGSVGKWAVFNQDRQPMPVGASFNVLVMPAADGAVLYVHRATAANVSGNSTYLVAPSGLVPGEVGWLWLTANWNPGNVGGTYNNHAVGVWYDEIRRQWAIFNQDRQPMPVGAAFNLQLQRIPQ